MILITHKLEMSQISDDLPIAQWIFDGQKQNATYLIVVWDALDGIYKPVYTMADENLSQKRREYEIGSYSVLTYFTL